MRQSGVYYLDTNDKPSSTEGKVDSIRVSKNVNGWHLSIGAEPTGKITISGSKPISNIVNRTNKPIHDLNEPDMNLKVSSAENRLPNFVLIQHITRFRAGGESVEPSVPEFIEVNDGKEYVTDAWKQKQDDYKYKGYNKQFLGGSVMTPSEFLGSMLADCEELVKDKAFVEHAEKIAQQVLGTK
jgi:hypothetical protein